MHRLTLAAAAALVLIAGACATPSAEKSAAGGSAESHAKDPGAEDEKTDPGSKSGAEGKKPSWWQRLSRYHREPKEKPWVYGDVRPGKGLLGNDEDGFVLYRQGEGESSDPDKPTKVRR